MPKRYRIRQRPGSRPAGGFLRGLTHALSYGAAQVARGYAQQMGRNWAGTATQNKRGSSGVGVTVQHDSRRVYRYKRMPRRKRKQWKKWVKKVQAVNHKNVGTKTVVFSYQNGGSFGATGDQQAVAEVMLYGYKVAPPAAPGLNNYGNADVRTIMASPNIAPTGKVQFTKGVMDVTITNTSSTTPNTLEVDVYQIGYYGKKSSAYPDLRSAMDDAIAETPQVNGVGTALGSGAYRVRGVTPFELGLGLKLVGAKIEKKTKYFISSGQAFTYQIRDPRNHWCHKIYFDSDVTEIPAGFNWSGKTKSLFIVAKRIPGASGDPLITVGCTRTYQFKQFEDDTVEDAVVNAVV